MPKFEYEIVDEPAKPFWDTATELDSWITECWRSIAFTHAELRDLPSLRGLYAIRGLFRAQHSTARIIHRRGENLNLLEAKGLFLKKDRQEKSGFYFWIYIGSSKNLRKRWRNHSKKAHIFVLKKEGVGIDFFFYADAPGSDEANVGLAMERRLIAYLHPILNSPKNRKME